MNELERRNLPRVVELRDGSHGKILAGYAATYNRYSQNLGGFVEQVDPGAFTKSLADNVAVIARYNHNDAYLLGTTAAETLRLFSDNTGLGYEVDMPDTSYARDLAVLATRGDVRYSSFAFRTMRDDWSLTDNGFPLRTLYDVQLVDVAPVNTPAYLDTSSGMRSLAEKLDLDPGDIKEMELEELRHLIAGDAPTPPEARGEENPENGTENGQSETHPASNDVRRKLLDLKAQR